MSLQLGSYAVEGTPGAPGWRGVGRDEQLGRAIEATFLGTPDGGAYDWLLLLAARASAPRPQVVPLGDLVAGPQGLFAITPPAPPMPVRLTGGAADHDLLARMAQTVAALHADGIFHGALRDWWRDDGGTPVLTGTGFAWLLAGQRFGRFEEGFVRDRDQLEQLRAGGGAVAPAIAPLPGADAPRRTVLLDRGAALAGMPATPPPMMPGGSPPADRTVLMPDDAGGAAPAIARTELLPTGAGAPPAERTVLMPGGAAVAPAVARTELLPTGSGAPPAERTMLMPGGGAGGPAGAPGGVARTELLPTAPAAPAGPPGGRVATTAAPVVLGNPGAGPPGSLPAIETIIEHRPAANSAAARPPARKASGRALLLLGVVALVLVVAGAGLGAWWWISHRQPASSAAAAATVAPAAAVATAPLQVIAVPWGMATVRAANGTPPAAGSPQSPQPTPFVLELPPGRYVVAVSNPELGGAEQRCEVEVQAGAPATCRVVLKQWSAADYFRSVGWR